MPVGIRAVGVGIDISGNHDTVISAVDIHPSIRPFNYTITELPNYSSIQLYTYTSILLYNHNSSSIHNTLTHSRSTGVRPEEFELLRRLQEQDIAQLRRKASPAFLRLSPVPTPMATPYGSHTLLPRPNSPFGDNVGTDRRTYTGGGDENDNDNDDGGIEIEADIDAVFGSSGSSSSSSSSSSGTDLSL